MFYIYIYIVCSDESQTNNDCNDRNDIVPSDYSHDEAAQFTQNQMNLLIHEQPNDEQRYDNEPATDAIDSIYPRFPMDHAFDDEEEQDEDEDVLGNSFESQPV